MGKYNYSAVVFGALACYLAFRASLNVQIEPVAFELPEAPALDSNRYISTNGKRVFTHMTGAESFAVNGDGWVFTGLANGLIVSFHPTTLETRTIVRTGADHPNCGSKATEPLCGRPLGMEFDATSGRLLVADGYRGLLSVDVVSKEVKVLATGAGGREFVFLNGLAIGADGMVYLSDSSSRHTRNEVSLEILEGVPTGRLVKYNPKTGETTVLLDQLPFPNGLCFTHNKQELLFALWSRMQIMAYNPATNSTRVFATTPGPPDNISLRPNGKTYWVALSFRRAKGEFSKIDVLAGRPWVRRIAAWLFDKNFFTTALGEKYGLAVEVNETGQVVSSIQEQDRVFFYFSEVLEIGSKLFIGSFQSAFIVTAPAPK